MEHTPLNDPGRLQRKRKPNAHFSPGNPEDAIKATKPTNTFKPRAQVVSDRNLALLRTLLHDTNKKLNFHEFLVKQGVHPVSHAQIKDNNLIYLENNNDMLRIVESAAQIDQLFPKGFPMLCGGANSFISLSHREVHCLISHIYLCTMEQSCKRLFESNEAFAKEKLLCILSYLNTDTLLDSSQLKLERISRRTLTKAQLINSKAKLCDTKCVNYGKIEDHDRAVLVDFANKDIGGGVLTNGCLQEELLFIAHTPCIVTKVLLTEGLRDEEVLKITGAIKYCNTVGYGRDFLFKDKVSDINPAREIICMDAINYTSKGNTEQYKSDMITRELNKARIAFVSTQGACISTGHWGCGDFGGDKELKSLIQIVAASGISPPKRLIYNSFGDDIFGRELELLLKQLNNGGKTSGYLMENIYNYADRPEGQRVWSIFQYLLHKAIAKKK